MVTKDNQKLGIVIVTYGHEATIKGLLDKLEQGKKRGDFIVLVDNYPNHKSAAVASTHPAVNTVIKADNKGLFAGGSNLGAAKLPADIDLVWFLNPDTMPLADATDKIRQGKADWAAWMPLLLLPDGKVNSAGNVLHISGLSWVSHFGEPADQFTKAQQVNLLSGACMVIRRKILDELGGFSEIMYYEDVDLSLRLELKGYKLGLLPSARITHDYVFKKGKYKFFFLERNRYLLILRTWPTKVILLMLPVLITVEIGLWAISLLQLRFFLKIKSSASAIRSIPQTLKQRRQIQANRKINSKQFLALLQPEADSPLIGVISKLKPLNYLFVVYYHLVGGDLS